tara:strand:+ start:782 stop:1069 length:288 start_codon:yes stop_codon:yes gene_type:complete
MNIIILICVFLVTFIKSESVHHFTVSDFTQANIDSALNSNLNENTFRFVLDDGDYITGADKSFTGDLSKTITLESKNKNTNNATNQPCSEKPRTS